MKGQISAEMLIILVILIGVVIIVASQLLQTAGAASAKVDEESKKLFDTAGSAGNILGGEEGEYCDETLPCKEHLSCVDNICS